MEYSVDKDNATWRILDGEAVIINTKTSYYYSLNKTGTYIWGLLLENKLSLNEIIEKISSHYKKGEKEITDEVKQVLEDLYKEKLIKGS